MMTISIILIVLILLVDYSSSFHMSYAKSRRLLKGSEIFAWPGTRPPVPNVQFWDQRMDATWGRGKFRVEIWEDVVNPVNDWWSAYAPSEEEIEAASAGYDFKDPKGWLAVSHYRTMKNRDFRHSQFDDYFDHRAKESIT